jgi:hypothetical protein
MKVYVVSLMNDLGAVNEGLFGVVPTCAFADGSRLCIPEGGVTPPFVHEPVWLNHQVLFARNNADSALAGSAATNSDANATATPTSIGIRWLALKLAILVAPLFGSRLF